MMMLVPSDAPAAPKILRVGLTTSVVWLEPRQASDASSHMVLSQVFETPYSQIGPDAQPVPQLMEGLLELEAGAGGKVCSASVRPGVEFSDGTRLTPDHIISSLEQVAPVRADASLSRRGDKVVFSLVRPISNYEFQLSKRWCAVSVENSGSLFGTGPFMLGDAQPGDVVRLTRNPRHRNPVPLDGIEFRVYPPDADGRNDALVAAIDAGEVHFTTALPRDEVGRLSNVRKLFQPGNSTAMLYFNVGGGVFSDARVRRALSLAIDRYQLARVCYPDSPGLAARGLLPPNMASGRDGLRHDPREAKAQLDASGVELPPRLRTITVWGPRPYLPKPRLVVEELNRQLKGLGVELEAVPTKDPEHYFELLRDGEYDAVLGGWIADTEDPADFLEAVLGSEYIPIPGRPTALTANLARWNDAATDESIRRYRESPSEQTLEKVLSRIAAEVPLLPLSYGPRVFVHTRNVRNFDATPAYVPSFAQVDLD